MKRQITITAKAFPGEKVMVKNYRSKYEDWESGEVADCECSISENGKSRMCYRVRLERKSQKGNLLFLHVGDNSIELQSDYIKAFQS